MMPVVFESDTATEVPMALFVLGGRIAKPMRFGGGQERGGRSALSSVAHVPGGDAVVTACL